jgi:hypothetical protein
MLWAEPLRNRVPREGPSCQEKGRSLRKKNISKIGAIMIRKRVLIAKD